jgi:superfamily II DNA or RNA helicase
LTLKGVYRTATDSLIRDFYIPSLSKAVQYDRAVGFFSSSMIIEAAFGLSGLIRNGGRMRLLIGHPLSDEDFEAVRRGDALTSLHAQFLRDLASILERAGTDRSVHSLELLSWMVATNSIEIRYAFRRVGMYHEKIGIITDEHGDSVVFHGSANESANALLPTRNFESLAVYPSWRSDIFADYGSPFVEGFQTLWNNTTPDVVSVAVPSEYYEYLLKYRRRQDVPPDLTIEHTLATIPATTSGPTLPSTIGGHPYSLRTHQQDALRKWHANAYCGILALATGSGKTIIALHAATRFAAQGTRVFLIVAVPYQILAEQWIDVMTGFSMQPIRAFYSIDQWHSKLEHAISSFMAGSSSFAAVVVVNDTLSSAAFAAQIARLRGEYVFFVGDECHHHSSEQWIGRIPGSARFKLGMSATPWNPGQDDRRRVLERIYGPVIATYGIADALRDKVLCEYFYHWIPCALDEEEAGEFVSLSVRISSLIAQDPDKRNPAVQNQLNSLLARRSRLVGGLRSKLPRLRELLDRNDRASHTLVYCGEGYHPLGASTADEDRVINSTIALLAAGNWRIGRITASESVAERKRILAAFDEGVIEAIAAIRVLDEGFDIPSCRTAYLLASSNSYRQYVQRRGRVLRQAPGKTYATIYDFVAMPTASMIQQNEGVWRRHVNSELARVREFVELATNSSDEQLSINHYMDNLGLGAIYYEERPISVEDIYVE